MSHLEFAEEPLALTSPLKEFHASQYLRVLSRRRWIVAGGILLASFIVAVISISSTVSYRSAAVIHIDREKSASIDPGAASDRDGTLDPQFVATEMRLMENRAVAERAVRRLGMDARPGVLTDEALALQQNVDVKPVRGTNLVELSYVDPSSERAARVANALAQSYIDWKVEAKSHAVDQTSEFLGAQIAETRKALDAKERQLLALGRQKNILTDPRGNIDIQSLETLSRGTSSALTDRVAGEARWRELSAASPQSLAISNPLVGQLQADLAKMERDYAQKLTTYKPEFPAMQQLKDQIDRTKEHLGIVMREAASTTREAARADYKTALRREESLKSALSHQREQALAETSDLAQYGSLKAEVDTQRALLDTLMRRAAETEVLARMQGERLSNVRIVETALPARRPFTPSYPKNAAVALALGLLFGVAGALGSEYMDRSLKTREDVHQVLQLPVLGAIPRARMMAENKNASMQDLLPASRTNGDGTIDDLPYEISPWAAAYRAFRTSLLLTRTEGLRVVAITSAIPFEGKTSTAMNLAVCLAQLGKKILLVDCDLHRPRIHEILQLPMRVGLTSVLEDGSDPSKAIYGTRVPGVFAVVAGPPVADPSALLHGDAMSRFLRYARAEYDHVILDTPPVLAVPDAVLLGRQADGVVLIMKGGGTAREQIVRARDELIQGKVRILGVLINGLTPEDIAMNDPGVYRGYGGYGYGGRRAEGGVSAVAAGT